MTLTNEQLDSIVIGCDGSADYGPVVRTLVAECRSARAENIRLREALNEIAAGDVHYESNGMDPESEFGDRDRIEGRWANKARLTLAATTVEAEK